MYQNKLVFLDTHQKQAVLVFSIPIRAIQSCKLQQNSISKLTAALQQLADQLIVYIKEKEQKRKISLAQGLRILTSYGDC